MTIPQTPAGLFYNCKDRTLLAEPVEANNK